MTTTTRCAQHPRGRTLHLLDVENLAGGTAAGATAVAPSLAAYRSTIAVSPLDHVLIASGAALACATAEAWPGARLLFRHGLDGADLALLDATDPAFTATHYDRVVIGSGDHIFCRLVSALRPLGLAVVVVARADAISRDLRRLAPFRPLAPVPAVALAA